jgi:hypothetical protein
VLPDSLVVLPQQNALAESSAELPRRLPVVLVEPQDVWLSVSALSEDVELVVKDALPVVLLAS